MSELKITCPGCRAEIALTESLAAPLLAETRAGYEARLAEAEAQALNALEAQKAALLAEAEAAAGKRAEAILADERQQAKAVAAAQVIELTEAKAVAKLATGRLKEAAAAQARALRRERELEAREASLDLAVEQRLAAEREELKRSMGEDADLQLKEKDVQMQALRRQIETLRKKAEQGSQQLQGEALEVLLEERLGAAFPGDTVAPVAKGVAGADLVQRVAGGGAILWETKQTRNWQPAWLAKLREDQRAMGAEVAVLVSAALPKEVETFATVDGVWVTTPAHAVPLAAVLRQGLIEIAAARGSREGQETKTALVYDYLTGPRFRQRVEAIVEHFEAMRADLEKERKRTQLAWSRRDAQLAGVLSATMGMYGDLQGIAGRAMPEIEGLEVPLLPEGGD